MLSSHEPIQYYIPSIDLSRVFRAACDTICRYFTLLAPHRQVRWFYRAYHLVSTDAMFIHQQCSTHFGTGAHMVLVRYGSERFNEKKMFRASQLAEVTEEWKRDKN